MMFSTVLLIDANSAEFPEYVCSYVSYDILYVSLVPQDISSHFLKLVTASRAKESCLLIFSLLNVHPIKNTIKAAIKVTTPRIFLRLFQNELMKLNTKNKNTFAG